MRQVVLDTETTGIGHENGHRIIEIGCIELLDRQITKNHFHVYLNPERLVDEGAFRVHGISDEFLRDKPLFKEIAEELLRFIAGAELIIHNAAFDVGFLNVELKAAKYKKAIEQYCSVFDTLTFARELHPGQKNNLDALCKRYNVDNSNRELHGALLDAELLARLYLLMTGGQQNLFDSEQVDEKKSKAAARQSTFEVADDSLPVIFATEEELAVHQDFIKKIVGNSGKNYWE